MGFYLTVVFLCFYQGIRAVEASEPKIFNTSLLEPETDEQRLLTKLFKNYNTAARPVFNSSKSVDIEVDFSMTQLYSVDDLRQEMTVTGWIGLGWIDETLHWNPDDFGGIKTVDIPSDKVWIPPISFENSAGTVYSEDFYNFFQVEIDYQGNLYFIPGGKFTTLCHIDTTYYPFDQQSCNIRISGWSIPGNKVDFIPKNGKIDLSYYQENIEWKITNTTCERIIMHYPCCKQSHYPNIKFVINLQRKPGFYIINIIIPCILLGLLDIFVFIVPAESGEKVAMGMTVLLSFSVFSLMISEQIPRTSDGTPIIVIYLIFCMGMSATTVVISVLVMWIYYNRSTNRSPTFSMRDRMDKDETIYQNSELFDAEDGNGRVPKNDENYRKYFDDIEKHFMQLKRLVAKIEQRLSEKQSKLQKNADLKVVTSRIEKLCALIFTVGNILVPIGIFYLIPQQQ